MPYYSEHSEEYVVVNVEPRDRSRDRGDRGDRRDRGDRGDRGEYSSIRGQPNDRIHVDAARRNQVIDQDGTRVQRVQVLSSDGTRVRVSTTESRDRGGRSTSRNGRGAYRDAGPYIEPNIPSSAFGPNERPRHRGPPPSPMWNHFSPSPLGPLPRFESVTPRSRSRPRSFHADNGPAEFRPRIVTAEPPMFRQSQRDFPRGRSPSPPPSLRRSGSHRSGPRMDRMPPPSSHRPAATYQPSYSQPTYSPPRYSSAGNAPGGYESGDYAHTRGTESYPRTRRYSAAGAPPEPPRWERAAPHADAAADREWETAWNNGFHPKPEVEEAD